MKPTIQHVELAVEALAVFLACVRVFPGSVSSLLLFSMAKIGFGVLVEGSI